jgi:hypothetical protein
LEGGGGTNSRTFAICANSSRRLALSAFRGHTSSPNPRIAQCASAGMSGSPPDGSRTTLSVSLVPGIGMSHTLAASRPSARVGFVTPRATATCVGAVKLASHTVRRLTPVCFAAALSALLNSKSCALGRRGTRNISSTRTGAKRKTLPVATTSSFEKGANLKPLRRPRRFSAPTARECAE